MHLVRDQTALNPQHHPLDCEHVGSLFVERAGYHERQHVSLLRSRPKRRGAVRTVPCVMHALLDLARTMR